MSRESKSVVDDASAFLSGFADELHHLEAPSKRVGYFDAIARVLHDGKLSVLSAAGFITASFGFVFRGEWKQKGLGLIVLSEGFGEDRAKVQETFLTGAGQYYAEEICKQHSGDYFDQDGFDYDNHTFPIFTKIKGSLKKLDASHDIRDGVLPYVEAALVAKLAFVEAGLIPKRGEEKPEFISSAPIDSLRGIFSLFEEKPILSSKIMATYKAGKEGQEVDVWHLTNDKIRARLAAPFLALIGRRLDAIDQFGTPVAHTMGGLVEAQHALNKACVHGLVDEETRQKAQAMIIARTETVDQYSYDLECWRKMRYTAESPDEKTFGILKPYVDYRGQVFDT